MFESKSLAGRLTGEADKRIHTGGGLPQFLLEEEDDSKRRLRWALIGALAFHLALFVISVPERKPIPLAPGPERTHLVMQPVRFEPPAPAPTRTQPQRVERKKVIPVPDPTPDEPEPVTEFEVEVDVDEVVADVDAAFGIPDAPPGYSRSNAVAVGGGVDPPVKIHSPQPRYTEDARRAGVEGVVILETVVDEEGNVRDVKVLKGLPYGLDQSAVDTVKTWRYEPALRDGEPVAVYFTFTINFSIT